MKKPIRASTIVCLLAIMLALTCWPALSLADESFQWTEPVNVSQSLSESEGPVIVSGSDGKTHIIWEEESVLVHSCLDGETWTDPLVASMVRPGQILFPSSSGSFLQLAQKEAPCTWSGLMKSRVYRRSSTPVGVRASGRRRSTSPTPTATAPLLPSP